MREILVIEQNLSSLNSQQYVTVTVIIISVQSIHISRLFPIDHLSFDSCMYLIVEQVRSCLMIYQGQSEKLISVYGNTVHKQDHLHDLVRDLTDTKSRNHVVYNKHEIFASQFSFYKDRTIFSFCQLKSAVCSGIGTLSKQYMQQYEDLLDL